MLTCCNWWEWSALKISSNLNHFICTMISGIGLPKELSGHSKTFWFFSNNLSLDQGISSCSSSLISCLPCGNSRNLPTNTSIWLLATLSLANSKWVEQNLSTYVILVLFWFCELSVMYLYSWMFLTYNAMSC